MKKSSARPQASLTSVLVHLLPAVLLFALFAAVGILHVTSRVLVVDAGYRLSRAENESHELTRENDRLKLELATLKAPGRLERAARERLGMVMPTGGAIVSLTPELPKPERRQQLVRARRGASVEVADRSLGQ